MNTNPKISIIIPVFNVEAFLDKCVNSIINQTYKNLEIILVNDESTDDSGNICDNYARLDDRVKVLHQKNNGAGVARNTGLKIASGDYIGFVDSDDWIDQDKYNTMINIAINHGLDVVECDIVEQSSDDISESNKSMSENLLTIENQFDATKRIINNSRFSVCRRIYKSELIKNYKFIPNKSSEDVYFTIDLIEKIKKIGYFKYPFYNYRVNLASVTKSPYSIKKLNDSVDSILYLKEKMSNTNSLELETIVKTHVLWKLMLNYKRLNYNSGLDKDYIYRKKLKSLIKQNYFKNKKHDVFLKLANYLSVSQFEILIKVNKFRHTVFNTNEFN